MDRSRPGQILESWRSVAASAVQPATAPRRTTVRSSLPGLSLAGLLVAALVVAVVWMGLPGSDAGVGAVPTPSPTATPSETPAETPDPSPELLFGTCLISDLHAAVTGWEGAAGSRIATVVLSHAGRERCWIPSTAALHLIDSTGAILISGPSDRDLAEINQLSVDDRLTTLVRTSNYCGDAPVAPVTIVFVSDTTGSEVVAAPYSSTDDTVPPCNGPGQRAAIEMQPWTR